MRLTRRGGGRGLLLLGGRVRFFLSRLLNQICFFQHSPRVEKRRERALPAGVTLRESSGREIVACHHNPPAKNPRPSRAPPLLHSPLPPAGQTLGLRIHPFPRRGSRTLHGGLRCLEVEGRFRWAEYSPGGRNSTSRNPRAEERHTTSRSGRWRSEVWLCVLNVSSKSRADFVTNMRSRTEDVPQGRSNSRGSVGRGWKLEIGRRKLEVGRRRAKGREAKCVSCGDS